MFVFQIKLIVLIYCSGVLTQQFHTNFDISHLEVCGANKGPILVRHINVTKRQDNQYLNFDIITKIPIGANLDSSCIIEYSLDGKTFVHLFTVQSKNVCKSLNKDFREFWYEIERSAQIIERVCPIPAGHYYAHNHLLNFRKMALQTFPFGYLKFTATWFDSNNHSNAYFCLFLEVENVFN